MQHILLNYHTPLAPLRTTSYSESFLCAQPLGSPAGVPQQVTSSQHGIRAEIRIRDKSPENDSPGNGTVNIAVNPEP